MDRERVVAACDSLYDNPNYRESRVLWDIRSAQIGLDTADLRAISDHTRARRADRSFGRVGPPWCPVRRLPQAQRVGDLAGLLLRDQKQPGKGLIAALGPRRS